MAPQPDKPRPAPRSRAAILEELLQAHGERLRHQARAHSVTDIDAEDALHDASLAFLRNYTGPDSDDALHWMMANTKWSAWAITRRARRRCVAFSVSATDSAEPGSARFPALDPGPAERYEREETDAERLAALAQLKPDERIALILFAAGYSYSEIAIARGWTRTKVNRCLSEGRERIRKLTKGGRDRERDSF